MKDLHVGEELKMSSLTRVPEELDGDTDSPPLASRNAPHIVVSHPGVRALPQPQLCDDIVHLWRETQRLRCAINPDCGARARISPAGPAEPA